VIGRLLHENRELVVMGLCVLVMFMKDEDVYTMNVGDSRVVVVRRRSRARVLFPMWAMHALNVQKFLDKIKFKPAEQYQAGLERVSQTPSSTYSL
jgi:serine/threonine protein phosphatase PrpC